MAKRMTLEQKMEYWLENQRIGMKLDAANASIAQLTAELAEARRDSERLAWAWANPDKFLEAQRSTPADRTGREQIDAARKERV